MAFDFVYSFYIMNIFFQTTNFFHTQHEAPQHRAYVRPPGGRVRYGGSFSGSVPFNALGVSIDNNLTV